MFSPAITSFLVSVIVEPDSTIETSAEKFSARTVEPFTSNFSTPSSSAPSSVGSTLNVPLVIGDVLSSVIDDVFNVFSSRSTVGTTSSVLISRIGADVLIFVSLATKLIFWAFSEAEIIALLVSNFEDLTTRFAFDPLTTKSEPTAALRIANNLILGWIVSKEQFSRSIVALSCNVSATTAVAEMLTLLNASSESDPSIETPTSL